jgi:hypothetical protein
MPRFRALLLIFTLLSITSTSGCGVLIGNVKPVEEKSQSYGVMELNKANPDWERLDPKKTADEPASEVSPTEIPDVAYQSRKTASIISIDSACRKHPENPPEDLRTLTNLLFLGMDDITLRKEEMQSVQNMPALVTTIRGKLNNEAVMLKTLVFRRSHCVYDLVYLARPEHFAENEADFTRFVSSLRLK